MQYEQTGKSDTLEKNEGGTCQNIRRTRRQPLSCSECLKKKVKCSKIIPCTYCIKHNIASSCHREKVIVTSKTSLRRSQTRKIRKHIKRALDETTNISMKVSDISSDKESMVGLTHNVLHSEILFPTVSFNKETNWIELHNKLWNEFFSKMTYDASYKISAFGCNSSAFIHQGIVPKLFMDDHNRFWTQYAGKSLDYLAYWKSNDFLYEHPRDYYYWMSLYYINLANGLTFGHEYLTTGNKEFRDLFGDDTTKILRSNEIPRMLFKASLSCLDKSEFMLVPDIRSVQIYCSLSICFEAFGNVQLDMFLFKTIVGIARYLGLDKIDSQSGDQKINFQDEVGKRLWHTLCIIDWFTYAPDHICNITEMDYVPPRIITFEQLTEEQPLSDMQTSANDVDILSYQPDPSVFCNALYPRFMFEVAKVRYKSYNCYPNERNLKHALYSLSRLRRKFDQIYETFETPPEAFDKIDSGTYLSHTDVDNFYHSRYIMKSKFIEEMLNACLRLLPIVGRKTWCDKYRLKALKLSIEQLELTAQENIPSYFRIHWIVILHTIYAAMFILCDMLLFTDEKGVLNSNWARKQYGKCYDFEYKLQMIRNVIPIIANLKETHFTAKVGIAVIEKMLTLVTAVKKANDSKVTIERMSLKKFLNDLRIGTEKSLHLCPSLGKSQYIHTGDKNQDAHKELSSFAIDDELSKRLSFNMYSNDILHTQYSDILADTGWPEFLRFFYGYGNEGNGDIF